MSPKRDDDTPVHQRRSVRLPGFDYGQVGGYFVTICAQERQPVFGDVADGQAKLNPAGEMVQSWWERLPSRFPRIRLDRFSVMPDHFHGIVIVSAPETIMTDANPAHATSLPKMMQWFKTMTTNQYIRGVKMAGWPAFCRRLWQRNYYEHVIRSNRELDLCQKYIVENPAKWASGEHDSETPDWLQNSPIPGNGRTRGSAPTTHDGRLRQEGD